MYKNHATRNGMLNRYTIKILLIMCLTAIIIFLAILQSSASLRAQKITYVGKNVKILEVFNAIKKQTGFNMIYSDQHINVNSKVDGNFINAKIEDVMDDHLKNQPLTYTINKTNVIVKPKNLSFLKKITQTLLIFDVHGKLVDSMDAPLQGATVKIKNKNQLAITNYSGEFYLKDVEESDIIVISYVGYHIREVKAKKELGEIKLELLSDDLSEVSIVSTGYQALPKERATGSFTTIDEKTLNRSVGINILDRLDGVASGLLVNKNLIENNESKMSIHGLSTLFANSEPLIVLDGIPYTGTIDQINPIDIVSINLLKDAAASSIWGARSGNGVIVISTKKGLKNQKVEIGVTSTFTTSNKPNLYYASQMSSSDFIDLEEVLFNRGFYNSRFNNPYNIVSPAVEIFNRRKTKAITSIDSTRLIDELKSYDVRNDVDKYFYRRKIYQQYGLNVKGGSENHIYYMSSGYDKNLENVTSSSYDRITINAANTFYLFNKKLELSADINFITSNAHSATTYIPLTPYDRLIGSDGNSLAVVKGFRMSYVDTAGAGKLLDWHYRPLDELDPNQNIRINQYRLKTGINYKIIQGLNLLATFQYLNETNNRTLLNDLSRYTTRNQINRYSSISKNTVTRIIPLGGILNQSKSELNAKTLRLQLNYNKIIFKDHEVNGIFGYEGSDSRNNSLAQTLYGYDSETMLHGNSSINPINNYKLYYGTGAAMIPTSATLSGLIDINQSIFSNLSYSYKSKYILSGSVRRDESNLFGVKTNQKRVPLWSTGFAWNINQEKFYGIEWLPQLKIRITYGYNGNIDRSTSAYLAVTSLGTINEWGTPFSIITSAPNPSLRWEKIKTWNFGLDFAFKDHRIYGSFDIYNKNAVDLIGNSPVSFQSGVDQYKGNTANLRTKGIDVVINSRNLINRFQWKTSVLFNYNQDIVTSYKVKQAFNQSIVSSNISNPLEGYPFYAIFSFPTSGLDALGMPLGYLDGATTKDYAKIVNRFDPSLIKYHGSALPKYFGSIINTFNYKNLELSFNLRFKLDYYFRRFDVFSGSNYGTSSSTNYRLSEFSKRWQKAGDEFITRTPALQYPANNLANVFYSNSEDLVENANHIRLQDIRMSYGISEKIANSLKLRSISVFTYASNLGILWRANNLDLDPDYGTSETPQAFTLSFGINLRL